MRDAQKRAMKKERKVRRKEEGKEAQNVKTEN